MVSSDITYRLIQQTRLVEDIRQPAYENRPARANRLFARAFFAVMARDLIRSGRRWREIASLSRLRFSPLEIVSTIHHHQPSTADLKSLRHKPRIRSGTSDR
jgi:hypothetical protein